MPPPLLHKIPAQILADVLFQPDGCTDLPGKVADRALTGQNACTTTPFGSEAGLFQESGIPAVICGPGSVAQAHQPNEFVTVAQLDECAQLLGKVADWAERG